MPDSAFEPSLPPHAEFDDLGRAYDAPPASQRIGAVVEGRYRIRTRLGRGLTSDVYLADDLRQRRNVVIKWMNRDAAERPELVSLFANEAPAIARIQHPSVVRVYGYGVGENGRPYLVMEALSGETLSALLWRMNRVPADLALVLCRHAAQGLAAAHRAGIVHRDVKPDNLFVVGPLGAPYGLKLVDFGMAKVRRAAPSSHNIVLGTMQYMAPEQVIADPVDPRSDIYALGIVMFRLFTGYLPFDTPDGLDLLHHQLFSPVPPPSWLDDHISARLESIILRATRKHPDNRYPDMESLLADLDALVGLEPWIERDEQLVIEGDRYEPKSPTGREVAATLVERSPRLVAARS